MLENIKELRCILGTPQCLTIAALAVIGQFTKLTWSLRKLLTMMNVTVLKHQFVGGFQESILNLYSCKLFIHYESPQYLGEEKAKIEVEYTYRNCCNDETGLQPLNTVQQQPSTCSQRTCYYDKLLPHSIWISKQVPKGYLFINSNCSHRSLMAVTVA